MSRRRSNSASRGQIRALRRAAVSTPWQGGPVPLAQYLETTALTDPGRRVAVTYALDDQRTLDRLAGRTTPEAHIKQLDRQGVYHLLDVQDPDYAWSWHLAVAYRMPGWRLVPGTNKARELRGLSVLAEPDLRAVDDAEARAWGRLIWELPDSYLEELAYFERPAATTQSGKVTHLRIWADRNRRPVQPRPHDREGVLSWREGADAVREQLREQMKAERERKSQEKTSPG